MDESNERFLKEVRFFCANTWNKFPISKLTKKELGGGAIFLILLVLNLLNF